MGGKAPWGRQKLGWAGLLPAVRPEREGKMKNFMVLAAVLPLLLVFLLQFTLDQRNSANVGRFQEFVYTAKEQAKQEGCFTKAIQKELKENVAKAFQISEDEVSITASETVQYRVNQYGGSLSDGSRGLIHYKVSVPLHKLMAGHRLFGIKEKDNRGKYTIESYTASERLP